MSGNQPDYYVGALDTATDEKNQRIGAAWCNDDGSISININDFVVIRGSKSLYLRLFPNDRPKPAAAAETVSTGSYTTKDLKKDIPF